MCCQSRCMRAAGLILAILLLLVVYPASAAAMPLPPLRDGSVITGPGTFEHDGVLHIRGNVTLRNLDLDLRGPISVDAGAHFMLDHVHLRVSDPPGMPNGTSGLNCVGPAAIVIRDSTMIPVGTAHPMWHIRGSIEVHGFQTLNSEFHLFSAQANLQRLRIFELNVQPGTQLTGQDLDLVFLSDNLQPGERIQFSDIPADRWFSRTLHLGGGATATLTHVRAKMFLLYITSNDDVTLAHLGRVQLGISPRCSGRLHLPRGRFGRTGHPVIFPEPKQSDCTFRISLNDVNVDTWDVYTGGHADLSFDQSYIDELGVGDQAHVTVRNSVLLADWLSIGGTARVDVSHSTVGALSMAGARPDLATSQVHVSGGAVVRFDHVRFDCGIYARDHSRVVVREPAVAPQYIRREQQASVQVLPSAAH